MDKTKRQVSIIGKIVIAFIIILFIFTIACRMIVSNNVKKEEQIENKNTINQTIDN